MIKAKFGTYDGNTWEELCQVCLKLKFETSPLKLYTTKQKHFLRLKIY